MRRKTKALLADIFLKLISLAFVSVNKLFIGQRIDEHLILITSVEVNVLWSWVYVRTSQGCKGKKLGKMSYKFTNAIHYIFRCVSF